jgi:hypothetical protein
LFVNQDYRIGRCEKLIFPPIIMNNILKVAYGHKKVWGLQLFLIYWKAKIERILKISKGKI